MKYQARQLFFYTSALLILPALALGGAFAYPPLTPWTVANFAYPQLTPWTVVNCDLGGRLTVAVRNALPGDTIRFTGTCKEQVTITTDRLTLDGQGKGIIDGLDATCPQVASGTVTETESIAGLVEIDAAQGVTLEHLTVQNSKCDGIFFRGSSGTLRNVTVQASGDDGIDSEQAAITLEDSNITGNGENGMDLDNNSTANIFRGTVAFSDNPRFGVLDHHSLLFVSSSASLQTNNNQYMGIGVLAGGELMGYTDSKMTVHGNSVQGLVLINSGVFLSYSTTEISGNGFGITLVDGSTFTQTSGTLKIEGNSGVGMAAENSTVSLRQASSSDVAVFQVTGNTGVDLSLTFGARATLEGENQGTIGTVYCGTGVLVQGFNCPQQP